MDIKSLNQQIRKDSNQGGLFNFFKQTIRAGVPVDEFREYTVGIEDEMRIDLIMQKIYDLSPTSAMDYYEHVDVLLSLNNIDNPLNIPQGTIIRYPVDLNLLDAFRVYIEDSNERVRDKLAKPTLVPNKNTRKDKSRTDYLKNGGALPPTVRDNPKPPVRLTGDKYSVGGL